ncbi:Arm DNA-binding domain-containing protein [Moraxella bovis]|uniref:Arm DNA-binding domain-containing protein n=1 Tax=Moraxella bovis TaxID=476 RepID=UPI0030BA231E
MLYLIKVIVYHSKSTNIKRFYTHGDTQPHTRYTPMLTDNKIKGLKPTEKRYSLSAGEGLSIDVMPTGRKSWVLEYTARSTARMMFYSNGRLSDAELAKFQIYIFDVVATEKETTVGMNLYDREGNVTFSSRSQPMSVHTKYVYDSIPDSYAYVTKREASLTEYGYFSRSKWEDYYYLSKGNHKSEMWNRLNSGTRIRDLVPSTINSKSAGLASAVVRHLKYYPATAAELAGYIISINNGGLPNPVEGQLFPTLGGHYTHMANKHVLTHTPILTAIGCSDKPAVLFSVPFDDIKRDGTVRHGGTLPDSRRVIFTGRTSFDFVDIQNLPFPFTRRPS